LIAWNATTNGVSCALFFESSGFGSGNNVSLGTARIYDPVKITSNLIEANMAQDNFKNPFLPAISLYGNTGGNISSNTYTVPIRNADGMYLDSSDNELYVIVRYKGDPTPIDDITLTFS
jgi:glucose/arabinose dehydrogenase